MKKLVILCFLLKTQTLRTGQLTAPDSLWRALMVSKNDTNNVGRLNALDGANEFSYANIPTLFAQLANFLLHFGKINVESKGGEGSEFIIPIPVNN